MSFWAQRKILQSLLLRLCARSFLSSGWHIAENLQCCTTSILLPKKSVNHPRVWAIKWGGKSRLFLVCFFRHQGQNIQSRLKSRLFAPSLHTVVESGYLCITIHTLTLNHDKPWPEESNSPFLENAFPFFQKRTCLFQKRAVRFSRHLPSGWIAWRYGSASVTQVSLKNARYRTVYQWHLALVVPSVTPYNSFCNTNLINHWLLTL